MRPFTSASDEHAKMELHQSQLWAQTFVQEALALTVTGRISEGSYKKPQATKRGTRQAQEALERACPPPRSPPSKASTATIENNNAPGPCPSGPHPLKKQPLEPHFCRTELVQKISLEVSNSLAQNPRQISAVNCPLKDRLFTNKLLWEGQGMDKQ